MYNRASADPEGNPWSERKKLLYWDAEQKKWVGHDVPDYEPTKDPAYRPKPGAKGMDAIAGDQAFIMKPDGQSWLFAPGAIKDGPFPTHYEPVESPVHNILYPKQDDSPAVRYLPGIMNEIDHTPSTAHPLVGFTHRITEHYLSGPMSRFNSWLNELMPSMFVEISPELADDRGVKNGDWVIVSSMRGKIEARALVTRRIKPLHVEGRTVHQVAIPFHWGFAGETVGGQANDLIPMTADPNVSIHEGKVFAVQLVAGRIANGNTVPTQAPAPWPTRDYSPDTRRSAQPEGQLRKT